VLVDRRDDDLAGRVDIAVLAFDLNRANLLEVESILETRRDDSFPA